MSAASESQLHGGNGQLALDVVTATSNEFISPVIRSPRNHSQKPFDTERLFGASQQHSILPTSVCDVVRPHARQNSRLCRLSEIHNQYKLNIWKNSEKVRGFYPRLGAQDHLPLCSCRKP